MKRKPQNSAAFFENNSWYHRTKILQDDGSIKYSKKGGYAVYDLILPNIEYDIKVRFTNAEYLDALLERVAKVSASAGNKGREILNMAMKEAVIGGYIKTNPVTGTKPYKRQKPKITILSKEKIKVLLRKHLPKITGIWKYC